MNQLNVNLPELPYAVSEAMNRLRINIKFCGKNTRKILLTSCQPNEGKSTISAYLWKMLAEAGFPTVLVDVDLRKSVMKTRFQMDYDDDTTMGLNHYLSGMAEYEDVVYSTNIPNGYIKTAVAWSYLFFAAITSASAFSIFSPRASLLVFLVRAIFFSSLFRLF